MKRTVFALMTGLTLSGMFAVTSCQKEAGNDMQFRASMEACTSTDGKTVLSGSALNWVSGDQVAIYGTAGRAVFSATPIDPANTALLNYEEGVTGNAPYRAFYPTTITTDGVNVTLPAVQNTADGSLTEFPMYAQSTDENLTFKNLCGVLKLHLQKSDVSISNITLTANTQINGQFRLTFAGVPTLDYQNGGSNATILMCSEPQSIANGKDFYIYLPHGSYTSLSIEMEDAEGNVCTKTTKSNVTVYITRSQYTEINFGENDLTFVQRYPQGVLPGLFSVSEQQQVHFSQGFLQYNTATDVWRFANSQYDFLLKDVNYAFVQFNGWMDMFGWGTGNDPSRIGTEEGATFVDWGVNAISNGGNQPNMWRTFSKEEWTYLTTGRPNASAKVAVGTVMGYAGLILLPDNWTLPAGCSFTPGFTTGEYVPFASMNEYTFAEWRQMEAAGAVFIPVAGMVADSGPTGVIYLRSELVGGRLWNSSLADEEDIQAGVLDVRGCCCFFASNEVETNPGIRNMNIPVRLVKNN